MMNRVREVILTEESSPGLGQGKKSRVIFSRGIPKCLRFSAIAYKMSLVSIEIWSFLSPLFIRALSERGRVDSRRWRPTHILIFFSSDEFAQRMTPRVASRKRKQICCPFLFTFLISSFLSECFGRLESLKKNQHIFTLPGSSVSEFAHFNAKLHVFNHWILMSSCFQK